MELKLLVTARNKIGPSLVPWWTSAAQGVSLGKILLTRCVPLRRKLSKATGATSYQTGIYNLKRGHKQESKSANGLFLIPNKYARIIPL